MNSSTLGVIVLLGVFLSASCSPMAGRFRRQLDDDDLIDDLIGNRPKVVPPTAKDHKDVGPAKDHDGIKIEMLVRKDEGEGKCENHFSIIEFIPELCLQS